MGIAAIMLAVVALMAAAGAWIRMDQHDRVEHHHIVDTRHERVEHHDTADTRHQGSEAMGCVHSPGGCECYRAGYGRGRQWATDELAVHGASDTYTE